MAGEGRPVRVISLVPSTTETLRAWGADPIACTRFCEQPDLPTVGGTKNPDIDRIIALQPDLVVVCPEENRLPDAEAIRQAGIEVHVCSPRTVDEVPDALTALGRTIGVDLPPDRDGRSTKQPPPLRLRAFVPIWRRPWMTFTGDTYGSSVLEALGVTNIAADWHTADGPGGRYPTVELDRIRSHAPDVILAPSEPYSFKAEHLDELGRLAPTVPVDGQDLFWWGVRTPRAIERLHRSIHDALRPPTEPDAT